MDDLARIRAEQARRYQQQKSIGGHSVPSSSSSSTNGSQKVATPPAKKGKVICGKWFLDPPHQLTMKDMEALLSVYVRVAPQKEAYVSQIQMDTDAAEFFQSFLVRASFCIQRYGIMFGSFDPSTKVVVVDFIYEPKQASGPQDWAELDDPLLDTAMVMTKKFGLMPVGWIFSYKEGRGDYVLSAREVLKTAEFAAKYGDHCVVVSVSSIGGSTQTDFSPWQVSQQIVQIYKEGTLSPNPTEPHLIHSERELEAVKEESDKAGKSHVVRQATHDVDTALVTIPVPVAAHRSTVCRNRFGRLNRPDYLPTLTTDVKNVLQTRSGEPFWQVLTDLHLLICLLNAGVLNVDQDIDTICSAISKKNDSALASIKQRIVQAAGMGSGGRTSGVTSPTLPPAPRGVSNSDIQQIISVCHCSRTEAENALAAVNGNVQMAIELMIS